MSYPDANGNSEPENELVQSAEDEVEHNSESGTDELFDTEFHSRATEPYNKDYCNTFNNPDTKLSQSQEDTNVWGSISMSYTDENGHSEPENQLFQSAEDEVEYNSKSGAELFDLDEFYSRATDPYKKNEDYCQMFNIPNTDQTGIQETYGRDEQRVQRPGNMVIDEYERHMQESYDSIKWSEPVPSNIVRDCGICGYELIHCYFEENRFVSVICSKCSYKRGGVIETLEEAPSSTASPAAPDSLHAHPWRSLIGIRDECDLPKHLEVCWAVCHCCNLFVDEKLYFYHEKHICCGQFEQSCVKCSTVFNSLDEFLTHGFQTHQECFSLEQIASMLSLDDDCPCRLINSFA